MSLKANGNIGVVVSWIITALAVLVMALFNLTLQDIKADITDLAKKQQEHLTRHPSVEMKADLSAVIVRAANNKQKVDMMQKSWLNEAAVTRLLDDIDYIKQNIPTGTGRPIWQSK
jgi:hypothetical protein|tara:strand:+ start:4863 stop:5210 length:348 start_codon:yes stop_codon:yes gene_type:complete